MKTEIVKLYFQWPNGQTDSVRLETETLEEMKAEIDNQLKSRNAEYAGIDSIQECE